MPHFLIRFTCLILALQLLNCSVDAPDADSSWAAEDLGYNEQESLVEILVEKVFNMGNVIAEQDDGDSGGESAAKKVLSFDFFVLPHSGNHPLAVIGATSQRPEYIPVLYPDFIHRNFSPPPEV